MKIDQSEIDQLLIDEKIINKIVRLNLGIPKEDLRGLRSDELEDVFKYYAKHRHLQLVKPLKS